MIKVQTLTSWGLVARCGLGKTQLIQGAMFVVVISGEGVSPGQQRGYDQVRYDFLEVQRLFFRLFCSFDCALLRNGPRSWLI